MPGTEISNLDEILDKKLSQKVDKDDLKQFLEYIKDNDISSVFDIEDDDS